MQRHLETSGERTCPTGGTHRTGIFNVGRFADAEIDKLDEREMDDFEVLMEAIDRDLFQWLTGEQPVPPNYDTAIFRRIKAFYEIPVADRPGVDGPRTRSL